MGCDTWHAGYSTCSKKKYRYVVSGIGVTKVRGLGKMRAGARIRLALWTSNDFLAGYLASSY